MKKTTSSMVYLIAYRFNGRQFIYGTGDYTKQLFKAHYYLNLQNARKRYIKVTQTVYGKTPLTLDSINDVSEEHRANYLDFILRTRPACLALPAADLDQILNSWIIPPETFLELLVSTISGTKKARVEVRTGFIEKYRIYDIGKNMQEMLAYYETGELQRLA